MKIEDITFEKLPQAIALLIERMDRIEKKIDALTPQQASDATIDIDAASELIGKAKATIYTMVRTGRIPAYKQGKKLYFIESELRDWLTSTPTACHSKNQTDAENYIATLQSTRKRRGVQV